jgi:predicted ATP-dependent endonuclease of OLD family
MKIRRLRATDFAAIREADVELGPGLNILYGPNDLGKSTLADAIRLALLLPHTSTHIDEYVPWSGGQNPVVELTFETDAQRIWRVRKEFRKGLWRNRRTVWTSTRSNVPEKWMRRFAKCLAGAYQS